ncbi:hypothetical protein SAMN02746089_02434 [Caldanaerobius fijiensis DSM 17918]|uniref:Uncharacterized protein n=1 Tax=Caldanaerobius fijiensis DSM 17918 TaxID=1121256 RepID=A0A1M5DWD7_9THEO|nr:hypothetical protein [Caldanaerobius fijiensis]SHF71297.1 hypothetical protein SAMN02746089_02434 [Caldanaerobius fijiensis DSM 17918]
MTNEELILEILKNMQGDIKSIKSDIKALQEEQKSMREDIKALQEEQKSMREDIKALQEEQKSMREDIRALQEEQKSMREDVKWIKVQQEEHGQILRALREASEFQKAETDGIKIGMAKLEGKVNENFEMMSRKLEDLYEGQKSLSGMYGEHERELRTLKRKIG